jgi:hypothetical protein
MKADEFNVLEEQLKKRLDVLQQNHRAGLEKLNRLHAELTQTQETVLRIEGAIQVLREETGLDKSPVAPIPPVTQAKAVPDNVIPFQKKQNEDKVTGQQK